MALKGDLASVDLAQVFQMLAMNQKVGLLCIQAPRSWRALYFDPRGVTLYYNEHTMLDRVLAQMTRSGKLSEEGVQDARNHASRSNTPLFDSLLAGGFLSEADIEEAFRSQIEEEIYDLFFWRDARFEFFEGAATLENREGVVNERFFFSTDSMIMEAARRIDEWSYIQERVQGTMIVFHAVARPSPDHELTDAALQVLELVDGKRNVTRLVEITALSPFHVHKALAQLCDAGILEELPANQIVPAAKECVAEGRHPDAINLLERAIALQVDLPNSQQLASEVYESAQEYELSCRHLVAVAEHHAKSGDVRGAVSRLHHVVKLLPTDLATRERLLELTLTEPSLRAGAPLLANEGKELVDLYLEVEEIDRVRGILERLLRVSPNDLELKKSLVNVHTRAGDTRRVIELYESIAQDFVKEHKPIEAVKFLQKILLIDRSRKDISERIRSLYELDQRRRSRKRTLAALGAMFCVLSALGAGWFYYEGHSREVFERIDVSDALAAKDFEAAARAYSSFISNHPLTMVSRDAKAELERVEALRLEHEQQESRKQMAENARVTQLRSRYKQAWERYRTEERNENLDAALDALETVKKLVTEAGQPEDIRWANEVQVDINRQQLQGHLAEAFALEREGREHKEAGDWRKARASLVRLATNYERTAIARNVRVPVMLSSRPSGAAVLQGGRPLRSGEGSPGDEVVTPAVVWCRPDVAEKLELQRPGFEPGSASIDALKQDELTVVLTVIPEAKVTFDQAASTTAAAGGGWIAVGLRGGSLGTARVGGLPRNQVKLDELSEVYGAPVVSVDHVVYRTNDNRIACHKLATGAELWHVSLSHAPAHDPVVRDGRVFFGDTQGRLLTLDLDTGKTLWFKALEGSISGPPQVEGRYVRVATQPGDVVVFDTSDGSELFRWRVGSGLSTGVVHVGGTLVFGNAQGIVAAYSIRNNKPQWSLPVGRPLKEDAICVTPEAVFVPAGNGELWKLSLSTGQKLATYKLNGELVYGPIASASHVVVVVRPPVGKGSKPFDVLVALDHQLEAQWDYRDGTQLPAAPNTDGRGIYVTTQRGDVLRMR
jgi:outer membrane protein assembly factor BamB/tetratricopeptide (TPR) repeat protein